MFSESTAPVSAHPAVELFVAQAPGPAGNLLLVIHGCPDWDHTHLKEPLSRLAGRYWVILPGPGRIRRRADPHCPCHGDRRSRPHDPRRPASGMARRSYRLPFLTVKPSKDGRQTAVDRQFQPKQRDYSLLTSTISRSGIRTTAKGLWTTSSVDVSRGQEPKPLRADAWDRRSGISACMSLLEGSHGDGSFSVRIRPLYPVLPRAGARAFEMPG